MINSFKKHTDSYVNQDNQSTRYAYLARDNSCEISRVLPRRLLPTIRTENILLATKPHAFDPRILFLNVSLT